MKQYFIYIMASMSGVLYTGVTNNLERRVFEHKHKLVPGFTQRYNITKLVYFEEIPDIQAAILREKQIKAWRRSKRVELICTMNPRWEDLAKDWYECPELPS